MKYKIDLGSDGGMSLFVSYIPLSITYEQIRYVFEYQENLGPIRLIKLLRRKTKTGGEYNVAYIYFKFWYNCQRTCEFQMKIQVCRSLNVKCDNQNHYWKVFANKYWIASKYELDGLRLELYDLKDKHDIVSKLLDKYRDYCYNDTFEDHFERDMRELMGGPENSCCYDD